MAVNQGSIQRLELADIREKYKANICEMSSRELLDELEKRALMASYGYQDPTTALMLREAKLELLHRTKDYEPSKSSSSVEESKPQKRQSLFD